MSMANWDTQPGPLRLPCQNCGSATAHRDRMGFCPTCHDQLERELEELEQIEYERDTAEQDTYLVSRYRPR